jgi:hypothetical protein
MKRADTISDTDSWIVVNLDLCQLVVVMPITQNHVILNLGNHQSKTAISALDKSPAIFILVYSSYNYFAVNQHRGFMMLLNLYVTA